MFCAIWPIMRRATSCITPRPICATRPVMSMSAATVTCEPRLALGHGHVQRRLRRALAARLGALREHARGARLGVALDDRDGALVVHLDRPELDRDLRVVGAVVALARDLGARRCRWRRARDRASAHRPRPASRRRRTRFRSITAAVYEASSALRYAGCRIDGRSRRERDARDDVAAAGRPPAGAGRPGTGGARRRAHRGPACPAVRHGDELARREPRRRAAAPRGRRGLGRAGRRVGAARPGGGRGRRAGAAEPPRHKHYTGEALARAQAAGAATVQISASGRRAPTSRRAARDERGVHVQPPRARSCGWRRSQSPSAPSSGISRRPRRRRRRARRPRPRRPAARAAAAVRRQRHQRLGRRRGRAQDPRDRVCRGRRLLDGVPAARAERRVGADDALVVLDRGGPAASASRWSPTRAPATGRSCTASAATPSARRSRSSRSRRSCSASRSRPRSASARIRTRSARICPAARRSGPPFPSRRTRPTTSRCRCRCR